MAVKNVCVCRTMNLLPPDSYFDSRTQTAYIVSFTRILFHQMAFISSKTSTSFGFSLLNLDILNIGSIVLSMSLKYLGSFLTSSSSTPTAPKSCSRISRIVYCLSSTTQLGTSTDNSSHVCGNLLASTHTTLSPTSTRTTVLSVGYSSPTRSSARRQLTRPCPIS